MYYVTPLFSSLSVFGAYFLGKRLWDSRSFYLGLSFVFAFVSAWPLYVTWGGNPFVTGFPLFLVCLGLFYSILKLRAKIKAINLAVAGLLFGYSAAIIISYLEALIVLGFLWFLYECVRSNHRQDVLKKFLLIFSISLLPVSPFLGRFVVFYQYPGHNVGIPADFSGWEEQQMSLAQALEWAFMNVSPYFFLRLELTFLLIGLVILFWKKNFHENEKRILLYALAVFLSSTLLSFASYFLSADLNVISWGHQSIILIIPICIGVVVFYMELVKLFSHLDFKWLSKVFSRHSFGAILISIMGLGVINVPFVYCRLVEDPRNLAPMYGLYAITNQNDYDLMHWMRENLSREAVVLVNPYESGLFIPTVSNHKIVFPYSGSQLAYGYQRLMHLITHKTLNSTAYDLMSNYNITHVFVGHDSTYWWETSRKWNPKIFLNNPNFKLVKRFGESYLLELSYFDAQIVFLDEFDYLNPSDMGWAISNSSNGNGEAEIVSVNGENLLKITSIHFANRMDELYFHETRVSREAYLWTTSNVTFSFNLESSSGFNGLDTFAFVISNIHLNRSIIVTTPNSVFQFLDLNGSKIFTLESYSGTFSLGLNKQWEQTFKCTLPKELVLQIKNLDFNGIDNTVLISQIMILNLEN